MSSLQLSSYRHLHDLTHLIQAFEQGTLPRTDWTHAAHLTVAFWYLYHFPESAAILRICYGIQAYNAALGILSTPTGGYHQTLTLFWIRLVQHYLDHCDRTQPLIDLTHNLLQTYCDKNLPLTYYSRDRLWSSSARLGWLEPDLKPLP